MVIHTPEWKSIPFQPGSTSFLYEVVFLPVASDPNQAFMSLPNYGSLPPLSSWISHRINNTQQATKLSEENINSNRRDKDGKEENPLLSGGRKPFIGEEECVTRVGVLFSSDLKKQSFETVVIGGQHHGTAEQNGYATTIVRLMKCTKILYHDENDNFVDNNNVDDCTLLSCQKLQQLIQFNQTLLNWKNYGDDYMKTIKQKKEPSTSTASTAKEKQTVSHDTNDDKNNDSTCLFCPLRSDSTSCTGDNDLVIDWDLIKQENSRQWDCLLDMIHPKRPPLVTSNIHSIDSDNDDDSKNRLLLLLENRIVYHRNIRYRLLPKMDRSSSLTARSPFPFNHNPNGDDDGEDKRQAFFMEQYRLDLRTATFADYFEKRHGMTVQQLDESLWEARRVVKLADEQPSSLVVMDDSSRENRNHEERKKQDNDNDIVHLIPEFVHVLPMPLDLLFLFSELTTRCISQLEREIDLHLQAQWLEEQVTLWLSQQVPQIVTMDDSLSRKWLTRYFGLVRQQQQQQELREEQHQRPLSSLLSEATTIFPRKTYERLEFLGDAVLSYFVVVIGGMSRNSALEWACDDFEKYISSIVSNTNLVLAARRNNLEQCLFTRKKIYQSAYRPHNVESKKKKAQASPAIGNSTLSDCIESILGAAYLTGKNPAYSTGGEMVLYFLEKLELLDGLDPCLSAIATRCCLSCSYPFDTDPGYWKESLDKVEKNLHIENKIEQELLKGCCQLLNILCADESCAVQEYLRLPWAKLLLQCALFDDNLDDKSLFSMSEPDDFIPVALIRDTLYIVGAFSLQLMITNDVYQRYPNATPSDMHMARACAMADDVVAYILIKSGCHASLFDKESPCLYYFQVEMKQADELGIEKWKAAHGMRSGNNKCDNLCCEMAHTMVPRYPGLAGGRLVGHVKKMPEEMTDELMFSFKAIAGALALTIGTAGMWSLLGPLFEELLALSPDELRLRIYVHSKLIFHEFSLIAARGIKRQTIRPTSLVLNSSHRGLLLRRALSFVSTIQQIARQHIHTSWTTECTLYHKRDQ